MAAILYSKEFKDRAVQAFLDRGPRPSREISKEYGVALSSLYVWVAAAAFGAEIEEDESPIPPDQWPAARRLRAISVFDSLTAEERGEFLRNTGLTTVHIEKWRQMMYAALETKDHERQKLEKRIRDLEREVDRKDKALAEAAALLILQKKARHLFSVEE